MFERTALGRNSRLRLRSMARSGEMGGGKHYHVQVSAVYNLQAMDASGLDTVLTKHSGTLQRHFERAVRKMNR